MEVVQHPSPNFNARRLPLSMLVLHYTGMENGAVAIERLCDPEAQVSAHYVVEEDGRILQLVDESQRAWHAGRGSWRGCQDINSASIGIEIVNGGHDFGLPDFPEVQIQAVIALCQVILSRHPIAASDVIGHSDLAPDRKQDPGERFPWQRLAEAGIGLWPVADDTIPPLSDAQVLQELKEIGYEVSDEAGLDPVITAFQRRFRPAALTGVSDPETRGLIGALARKVTSDT